MRILLATGIFPPEIGGPATYTKLLLQNPSKKEIVLFTCYPVGTTRERFVVWAEYEEGDAIATIQK